MDQVLVHASGDVTDPVESRVPLPIRLHEFRSAQVFREPPEKLLPESETLPVLLHKTQEPTQFSIDTKEFTTCKETGTAVSITPETRIREPVKAFFMLVTTGIFSIVSSFL